METVVITGGCGFLGTLLARKILNDGLTLPDGQRLSHPRVLLLDRVGATPPPGCAFIALDIADAAAVHAAIPANTAVIYHLAAVVSGQAEAEFELGMQVNLGGAQAVIAAVRAIGRAIPVIGTSSLAVYGLSVSAPLTERSPIQPQNSYGVAKAMAELLMADARRRGWADARTLRLPTVTVRPGKPNAAASSFASSILREPIAGQGANCPVSSDLPLWVASPNAAVHALWHAASVPAADWPAFGALNVPGIRVTVAEMLACLTPDEYARVSFEPDATIAAIVGGWPSSFDCALALALGFTSDTSVGDIAAQARG